MIFEIQVKRISKINVTIFCATFSIKAFFKITVEQHVKTSKGSRSNWMLKDEHKHWKVKTVTSLPHSVYRLDMYKRWDERLVCELRLMPLVWIGEKFWRPPFMNPLDGGSATNIFPEFAQVSPPAGKWAMGKLDPVIALEDKTWTRGPYINPQFGPVPWTPCHGPGPWTPCHGPGPWILFYLYRKVLDRVHGHSFLNNENWTKTEIVQKYDLTRHCRPKIKSNHQGRN